MNKLVFLAIFFVGLAVYPTPTDAKFISAILKKITDLWKKFKEIFTAVSGFIKRILKFFEGIGTGEDASAIEKRAGEFLKKINDQHMKIEEFVGSKAAGAENAFKEIAPVFLKFENDAEEFSDTFRGLQLKGKENVEVTKQVRGTAKDIKDESKKMETMMIEKFGKEAEDAIAQNKADREAELERQEAAEDDTIEK